MKNKKQHLQESLLAEFDAINKLGRGIGRVAGATAKGVGAVAGGVAGLGGAVKKGYQAGKQTVGGGGANVNTQQQKQQKAPGKFAQTMGNLAKNVGQVAQDTAAGSGYNYRQGVNPNPTGVGAGLKKADAEAQRKAGLEKKLGTTGTQATATNTAKTAVDKSIARNQKKKDKQSAMKQGINQATTQKGATAVPGQTATKVPGQKAPAQVDTNKDGKDDKTGKLISKTATDVGTKTGVNTKNIKAGGVNLDGNNPEQKGLIAAINKADPSILKGIDALQPADKAKLKKAIA